MNRDEQVLRNLDLAERFLGQILDHPATLNSIPDGGIIALMPADDPDLADANVQTARELAVRCPRCGHEMGPDSDESNMAGGVLLRAACP